MEDTVKLITDVDEPNVKVHMDTYHMNIEEKDFYVASLQAGALLGHVHYAENDRGIPGRGLSTRRAVPGFAGCELQRLDRDRVVFRTDLIANGLLADLAAFGAGCECPGSRIPTVYKTKNLPFSLARRVRVSER